LKDILLQERMVRMLRSVPFFISNSTLTSEDGGEGWPMIEDLEATFNKTMEW
jgi:hypothetical protein